MASQPIRVPDQRLTRAIGAFLVAVGALVLAGWTFDIAVLKGGFAGGITMKANAALALIGSGVSLRLLPAHGRWAPLLGRACAVFAGGLAALTLSEHAVGWNLGIDELLFREAPGAAGTASPGRMGPNASLSLTLAAIALWLLYRGDARAVARAQILAAVIAALATVPLVGYLYGATQLYAVARYTGIAVHTGVALLALSLGILAARRDTGPVAALLRDAPHGVMARRLLASSVAVPVLLGYLRLAGERRDLYDAGFGTGMLVVAVIVLLSVTTWTTAVALDRSHDARLRAQADRDDLLVRERAAREAAERAHRAKDEFLAMLSHELRTPLNAVAGWTRMLQQGAVSPDATSRAIEAVSRNASALARLIEDLLDASRIATGHLEISRAPVNMHAAVEAALESVMPAAEAKRVALSLTSAPAVPVVAGDAQRLQQVLRNVLSNAVKFSPAGGTVDVQVEAPGADVVVRVRDRGDGIDAAFLPHVFDQFRQGSSAPRADGSLGLGLHIAKHLVERHGGTIAAESAGFGCGAVFTIRLPACAASGSAPAPEPSAARSGDSEAAVS